MSRERLEHLIQNIAKTTDEISEEQKAARDEKLRKIAAALCPTTTKFMVEPTAEDYKAEIAALNEHIKKLEHDIELYYQLSELGKRCTVTLMRDLSEPSVIINVYDLDLKPHTRLLKVSLMHDDDDDRDWLGLESAD